MKQFRIFVDTPLGTRQFEIGMETAAPVIDDKGNVAVFDATGKRAIYIPSSEVKSVVMQELETGEVQLPTVTDDVDVVV